MNDTKLRFEYFACLTASPVQLDSNTPEKSIYHSHEPLQQTDSGYKLHATRTFPANLKKQKHL